MQEKGCNLRTQHRSSSTGINKETTSADGTSHVTTFTLTNFTLKIFSALESIEIDRKKPNLNR